MIRVALTCLCWLSLMSPALADEATQAYRQGQFERAIRLWEQQLTTANSREAVTIRSQLATAYQAMGMHRAVFLQLDTALNQAIANGDPAKQALILSQFSDAWLSTGDIAAAEADASVATQFADDLADPHLIAHSYNSLGNVFMAYEAFSAAVQAYQHAAHAVMQTDASALQATIRLNTLTALVFDAPLTDVLPAAESTGQFLQTLPVQQSTASHLLSYVRQIQPVLADPEITPEQADTVRTLREQALALALDYAQQLQQHQLIAETYGELGLWAIQHDDLKQAQQRLRQAIFYASQGNFPAQLYRWQWQMGRLQTALGETSAAINSYRLATQTLQPIQQQLEVGRRLLSGNFDEEVRPVYYELADLLLQQAAQQAPGAAQQALLKQARDTIEQAKLAELRNYFQDDCVSALATKDQELDNLVSGAAVIYPITLPDRLVLLVSAGQGIQPFTVAVSQTELAETTLALRIALQTRSNKRFLYPAQALYDWLIRPLQSYLQQRAIDTLIFVPDSFLRTIPPATLHDGQRFLIEHYALAITPGLTLTDPKAVDWSTANFLLAGLSDAVQDYPPLPNVPTELANIANTAQQATQLLNQSFSFESLRETLRNEQFVAVHLATHGEFSADPEETYLLTYEQKMTMDRLQSVIGLGNFREQPIELLTLSACRTAVGDDRAALGLAGVAVKAGARSAIATLWFVDDEATALTMQRFYQTLTQTPNITKAKALQQVQIALIQQVRYQHPAYWSPFLLIGNWL